MDFLVEFEINVPAGTPESEVAAREDAESTAAAKLVDQGHLVRLWKRRVAPGEGRPIGLYRADTEADMDGLLRALPLYDWMRVSVTPLDPHPNDPAAQQWLAGRPQEPNLSSRLPDPRLTKVYRLDATLAPPLELGVTARGRRRIVALTGGTFSGPEMSGRLLPGASADWQTILPDGTALGTSATPCRPTGGSPLRPSHAASVMAARRCSRASGGERRSTPASTRFAPQPVIETAAPDLEWLNKGIFISVAGRQAAGVIYETYLVG